MLDFFGALRLHLIRFNAVSFGYGLLCVRRDFFFKVNSEIMQKIAIFFGVLTTVLIVFLSGLSFDAYAMDERNAGVSRSAIKTSSPKVICNSLFIDLQRAKFRIVPYFVVQENDPKFFEHVLETSNTISFNGKYIGASYPYSKDPIETFVRNVILDCRRINAVKDDVYYRSSWVSRDMIYRYSGLSGDLTKNSERFFGVVGNFFSDGPRLLKRFTLNRSVLDNSYINIPLGCIYTFIEYIQGVKSLNNQFFTFSSKTEFRLKATLDVSFSVLKKNVNTNVGLYLSDNSVSLVFNNKILYAKNRFDFALLRSQLLETEFVCDVIRSFSIKDTVADALDSYYGGIHSNMIPGLGFTFYPTDYHVDNTLNITSINFTFNDEGTLD